MRKSLVVSLCLLVIYTSAQETPFSKFGKIQISDLQKKTYDVDTSASAVVLSDVGEASIEGNRKGWFSLYFTHHKTIHVLSKNGYYMADVEIPLYSNGQAEEELTDLKAVTYNLENGKIVQTKLEKGSVFTEKRNKNLVVKKFTFPNVKEGSIIEYQYKVISDYISHVDPWEFQGSAPRLWSEYKFIVPKFFTYSFLSYGYTNFHVQDKKERAASFTVINSGGTSSSETYNFRSEVTEYRWVAKDVPELKEESFTSTLKNHIARLEFELVMQSDPLEFHNYRSTWPALTKEMLESESFGNKLNSNNGWLADEMSGILKGANSDLEKAKSIYSYIRENFSCTRRYGTWVDESLKSVFKNKKGSVPELNILLTAMMRYAGLDADPVILSTTDNGYSYDIYPSLNRFNYTICRLKTGNDVHYLDASVNALGFGKLLPQMYNGAARVVNPEATQVVLLADSVVEQKNTSVRLSNGPSGNWIGFVKQTPGYFESYTLRQKIKEKGAEEYFKDVQKELGGDITLTKPSVEALENYDTPVDVSYNIGYNNDLEEIIYVNPFIVEAYKKNPFNSKERFYPVEMPYTLDETYWLTIDVPTGYEVDELPQQMLVKYDEQGKSYFEYRISNSGSIISLKCHLKLNRAFYDAEEYPILKEFFNMIVKKQSEQIVFKKK